MESPDIRHQRDLSRMTAAILAGGAATRLRGVIGDLPKCLVPVRGRPFLSWPLDWLAAAGLRRVVLCTGYLAPQVQQTMGARYGPIELVYSPEDRPMGTAGAVRNALSLLEGDTTIVLNGDSFCQADLGEFVSFHYARAAKASILLARVADAERFGQAQVGPDGRVIQFVEKGGTGGCGWINAGVYLLARSVIQSIPFGQPVSLETEVLPARVDIGLFGWQSHGRFIDIGTPASLLQADAFFADLERSR